MVSWRQDESEPAGDREARLGQFKPLHQLDLLHGGGAQQLIIISGRCLCSEGQRNQTSWQVGKTRGFGSTRRSSEMSEEKRIV